MAGKPQNGHNIIGYYIKEDGLETVKNQGRQDIKNRWPQLEDYWIKAIHDGEDKIYNSRQIISPTEHLSYQLPEKPFEVYEEDFMKAMMDYELYLRGIDVKEFNESILSRVLYGSEISSDSTNIIIKLSKN